MNAGVTAVTALLVVVGCSTASQAQTVKLGEVLVFNIPDLKADADAQAFESYVLSKAIPASTQTARAMELSLARKDRGPRAGRYTLVWSTTTAGREGYTGESSRTSPHL